MKELALIIPACNEAGSIKQVVKGFSQLRHGDEAFIQEIVVVDNNSTDGTAEQARKAGATVVLEPIMGYGRACQKGLTYIKQRASGPPELLAFTDGDGSSKPEDLFKIVAPLASSAADFTLGVRQQLSAAGALTLPQRFGNGLACWLIKRMYGVCYSDLGSLRAINWDLLMGMQMEDMTYGWSIEMQIKAAKQGLRIQEINVHNFPRTAGSSKVSGTLTGVMGAGYKIISTVFRYR
ncbi:MAG: glycosyltransferase family 2 protein [Planctomycetes bacterium]|nr:glycosyltransferase family 2 protein [Planctomycetota bacterium]